MTADPSPIEATDGATAPARSAAHPAMRWVVVVAREEADVYLYLRETFARDGLVRAVLDRRADPCRSPAWVTARLRAHGVAVIPVRESAGHRPPA